VSEPPYATSLRVLHLEDDPLDAELIKTELEERGYRVTIERVVSEESFTAKLREGGFDLILSDFALPGFDGLAALRIARDIAPDIPFITVSGRLGEEAAVECVRAGATDYVLKRGLSRLGHAVWRALVEAEERRKRRQAEEALRQSEAQLQQSQKMEAIGLLAGGVAHDFNNVLTAILGYTQLARMKLDPAHPASADLDEIAMAGERAADLTRQLLTFCRQQVLKPRALDLNALVLGLDSMLQRLIGADIAFRTRPGEGIGVIVADPGQMEQILLNLVVNARDAMPCGGGLTIETSEIALDETQVGGPGGLPSGRYVVLTVSDDGVGMEVETRDRIFEPFFTTKELGKGTGLGLSTVFGIVKQSGGAIEVQSEPGQGTTFRLYFPRVDAELESNVAVGPELRAATGSETVLLVEDDAAVRGLVRQTLSLHGYRVWVAQDGYEAVRVLEKSAAAIQLLITDIIMPGVSGSELVALAASLQPDMKVLCISGYAEQALVHQTVVVDGMPFLQKPFTAETLAHKVRDVLDGDRRKAA